MPLRRGCSRSSATVSVPPLAEVPPTRLHEIWRVLRAGRRIWSFTGHDRGERVRVIADPTTKNVLLLGRTMIVLEDAERALGLDGIELFAGTGVDDVRGAFAKRPIDHVIMGAGLDLDTRVQIIRAVFESSDSTTVHMKDRTRGAEGFLPFARAVLAGLKDWRE